MRRTLAQKLFDMLRVYPYMYGTPNLSQCHSDGNEYTVLEEADRQSDSPTTGRLLALIGSLVKRLDAVEQESKIYGLILGTMLEDEECRNEFKTILMEESALSDLEKATILGRIDRIGE